MGYFVCDEKNIFGSIPSKIQDGNNMDIWILSCLSQARRPPIRVPSCFGLFHKYGKKNDKNGENGCVAHPCYVEHHGLMVYELSEVNIEIGI